jgi:RsiW-degrading membrane proteinase PrsW (M82 family)
MKPPRPIFVIILLAALAIYTLARGPSGTGAEAAGYLFGAIVIPALLAVWYVRWYRRRST